MSEVRLDGVRKSFGAVDVIKGIDLAVEGGEFVVFVGPSGCGKSTLLRMISGLESTSNGRIAIAGRDVTHLPPGDRQVAMVFQSYALYPHMTAEENMSFGLRMNGRPKDEVARRVAEAARILQIEPLLARRPKQLSGGQRQRVAIGRAIVREPKVFLFDEPLSNLDAALRVQMRVEIARLHAEIGATMIYVTHDQVEAMTLADRIVVLNHGIVEQVGSPLELYEHPANVFVAAFIGSPKMNLIEGPVAERYGARTLGIRPENIALSSEGEWLGRVTLSEHLGSDTFLYVAVDEVGTLVVRMPGDMRASRGDAIRLAPLSARMHRFDAEGRAITSASPPPATSTATDSTM